MNEVDAFRIYHGIKTHFKSNNYDFFRYQGKTRIKNKHWNKCPQQYFFYQVVQRYPRENQIIGFFVANEIYNSHNFYIHNFDECNAIYRYWIGRIEGMEKSFADDISNILLFCEKNNYTISQFFAYDSEYHLPLIIGLYNRKKIHLETILILDEMFGILNYYKNMLDDMFFDRVYDKAMNYKSFFKVKHPEKYKDIFKKMVKNA